MTSRPGHAGGRRAAGTCRVAYDLQQVGKAGHEQSNRSAMGNTAVGSPRWAQCLNCTPYRVVYLESYVKALLAYKNLDSSPHQVCMLFERACTSHSNMYLASFTRKESVILREDEVSTTTAVTRGHRKYKDRPVHIKDLLCMVCTRPGSCAVTVPRMWVRTE